MTEINEDKLNNFVGKIVGDLGGAYSVAMVRLGDRLGLYAALTEGPATSATLAARTGLDERYVREWAAHHAASEYLEYDPASGEFTLPPEHAMVFADENSPVYMIGGFDNVVSTIENEPKVADAFRHGGGVAWGDQAGCMFCAVAKFFRPGYQHNLVQSWIPALDGVEDKLKAGARVADIGCGHGHSTLLMAAAYPQSEFIGYDFHEGSVEQARAHAASHGLSDRVRFEVATAKDFSDGPFDLVACFDALHDMGDPAGAASHIRSQIKPDGAWMVVEPMAGDKLEDNLHPVGRLFYAASTMICVPTSLAQEEGAALGAQAGEARLSEIIKSGGFSSVRRAAETPFNMILEARA